LGLGQASATIELDPTSA